MGTPSPPCPSGKRGKSKRGPPINFYTNFTPFLWARGQGGPLIPQIYEKIENFFWREGS